MAEFQEATEAPLSTTLEPDAAPSASGAGQPAISEPVETKDAKPASLRDDIAAVMNEAEEKAEKEPAKDEKADEKPAEAKPEEKPDAKAEEAPAKDAKDAGDEGKAAETKPEENGKHSQPPKNFLPDSREVWKNTPRAVRRDIETMARDFETRETQYQQATQRYEALKPFDDLARSNGRDLTQSLHRIIEIETALQENPIAGLNRILLEVGPRKADGQPFSLYEVADFIVRQGQQGYQQLVQQRQPANDQGNPQLQQLQEQVVQLQAQIAAAPMKEVIERFASNNARFSELQNEVAFFLKSDMIPASLPPEDRLAAAYDMAVRIKPDSSVGKDRTSTEDAAPDRRADAGFSGSKSIRSSPGAVNEEVEDQAKGGESVRDSILKAARRLKA